MKIEIFGGHGHRDVIELKSSPHEIELEDLAFEDDIHVICNLINDGDVVRVHCEAHALVTMQCSLCLNSFKRDVVGNFSLVAHRLKQGESMPENTREVNEGEDMLIIVDQNSKSIDITNYVRDAIILSTPLKSLCMENCKGLCSICGQNLNEGLCGCNIEKLDPRWKGLSNLMNEK